SQRIVKGRVSVFFSAGQTEGVEKTLAFSGRVENEAIHRRCDCRTSLACANCIGWGSASVKVGYTVFLGCKALVEDRPTPAANFCSGIVHGLGGVGQYLTPPEWQSCVPPTSDTAQLARVVINYIEARPQRMHEDFRRLTLEAFHKAWPCKSSVD